MTENKIRAFGLVAIVGGLLNLVGDLFIVSQPIPSDSEGIQFLAIMPVENVRIGVVIGLFALTSWLLVLPSLSAGLARASALERSVAAVSFSLFVAACVVYHNFYWPMTVAIQATAGSQSHDLMVNDLEDILSFFQLVIISSLLVFTINLASTVIRKRADYPWWVLLISPMVTLPTLGNLVSIVPAPYNGYVAAVTTTFWTTIFIAGLVLARRPSVPSTHE